MPMADYIDATLLIIINAHINVMKTLKCDVTPIWGFKSYHISQDHS